MAIANEHKARGDANLAPPHGKPANRVPLGLSGEALSRALIRQEAARTREAPKPRYVLVTNPAEVEAIRLENATGRLDLPIGGFANGQCWAVAESLEWYRETLRRDTNPRTLGAEIRGSVLRGESP